MSVENVVATIEKPKSHHGMLRPPRKNSFVSLPDTRPTAMPIVMTTTKYTAIMIQSRVSSCIMGEGGRLTEGMGLSGYATAKWMNRSHESNRHQDRSGIDVPRPAQKTRFNRAMSSLFNRVPVTD